MRTVITPGAQDADDVGALVKHLHRVMEEHHIALARKLHDEMGGLLVSAAMDLGWAEARVTDPDLSARLRRLGTSLGSAVLTERQIIEELRPTLLDTIGLFEALRWYFKHACLRVSAKCYEALPPDEITLSPFALSNIFRAMQTLLDCTFQEDDLCNVDLEAAVGPDCLCIRLAHQHVGGETVQVLTQFRAELGCAAHRVDVVGGELSYEDVPRGLVFQLKVPLTASVTAAA